MKLTDRVRALLLRLGIVWDVVDLDSDLNTLKPGDTLVVVQTQHEPRSIQ